MITCINIELNFPFPDNLNLHENQRYCWPVRPLPRRNSPSRDYTSDLHSATAPTNHNILSVNYSTNNASGLSSQAIGVVIPTTPNSALNEDNYASVNRLHQYQQSAASALNSVINHQHQQHHQSDINQTLANLDSELTWEQRLNFIQYFLSLTSKTLNKVNEWNWICSCRLNICTRNQCEIASSSNFIFCYLWPKGNKEAIVGSEEVRSEDEKSEKMVYEPKSEHFINSASLEDVEHHEVINCCDVLRVV